MSNKKSAKDIALVKDVLTIEAIDSDTFITQIENAVNDGYKISSTSCDNNKWCAILTKEAYNEFDLDVNEQNILSLTENKEIIMEVHGETKTYRPLKATDSSWDLKVMHEENAVYGLSCESFKELRAFLLVDYATGIITKAFF